MLLSFKNPLALGKTTQPQGMEALLNKLGTPLPVQLWKSMLNEITDLLFLRVLCYMIYSPTPENVQNYQNEKWLPIYSIYCMLMDISIVCNLALRILNVLLILFCFENFMKIKIIQKK